MANSCHRFPVWVGIQSMLWCSNHTVCLHLFGVNQTRVIPEQFFCPSVYLISLYYNRRPVGGSFHPKAFYGAVNGERGAAGIKLLFLATSVPRSAFCLTSQSVSQRTWNKQCCQQALRIFLFRTGHSRLHKRPQLNMFPSALKLLSPLCVSHLSMNRIFGTLAHIYGNRTVHVGSI